MPVQFTTLTNPQIDVTLLEADRVISVLVQALTIQIECSRPVNIVGWGCWSNGEEPTDLYGDVQMLVRDAVKSSLPDHARPRHDDLDIAVRSRMDENRAWINLPSRLDKVLSRLSEPMQVTLDAEFAYPSTCAALLDAFKVLNHPRLTFALSGNALDFIHAAGVGYGSQERAKHNAARLGIYA
jgi:hypothetical protein